MTFYAHYLVSPASRQGHTIDYGAFQPLKKITLIIKDIKCWSVLAKWLKRFVALLVTTQRGHFRIFIKQIKYLHYAGAQRHSQQCLSIRKQNQENVCVGSLLVQFPRTRAERTLKCLGKSLNWTGKVIYPHPHPWHSSSHLLKNLPCPQTISFWRIQSISW